MTSEQELKALNQTMMASGIALLLRKRIAVRCQYNEVVVHFDSMQDAQNLFDAIRRIPPHGAVKGVKK